MKELYTIKKGKHFASGLNFNPHYGLDKLSFSITPHVNCLYTLGNANDYDINKFFGVTWGLDPLKNSFRIGWNCSKQNGMIQYYYYFHNKGSRWPGTIDDPYKTLICESFPGSLENFTLKFNRRANTITLLRGNGLNFTMFPFDFNGVPNWGVYNHPYFGGDETAPHDMSMKIIKY